MNLSRLIVNFFTITLTTFNVGHAHHLSTVNDFDTFKIAEGQDREFFLICGLNDKGIEQVRTNYGWLPSGNIAMFKASDAYHGPVLSYGEPAFLLNRWAMFPHSTIDLSFVRKDGSSFSIKMLPGSYLRSCVIDVDLLDQILDEIWD